MRILPRPARLAGPGLLVVAGLFSAGCGGGTDAATVNIADAQPSSPKDTMTTSPTEPPADARADARPDAQPNESQDPSTTQATPAPPPAAPPAASVAAPLEGRNRLGAETSPYLLQHQHNPVNWWAWGPEAIEAARAADRPIFLSIGYSTCYWCHVMERESFENEEIAAIMNERFICIKVDREERPDVDDIYMAATQAITGRGGWPMSVFIDPHSLKPYFAGTYFPPKDGMGPPGFPRVLTQMFEYWTTERPKIIEYSGKVAEAVEQQLSLEASPQPVGAREVERVVTQLLSSYDRTHGGFGGGGGGGNKFPTPVNLDLLIEAAWKLKPIQDAILHTLDRMATGGMYDQIGGGFHRYSTDPIWLVPHFEKMLYDNGQLASTYANVYERTGDPYYAEIVRETLDYVLRDMTAPSGAFLSAQDAEVNHREGENYLWLPDQVRTALENAGLGDDVDFALEVYGFNAGTNFQDPHHPEDGRKNVVHLVAKPTAQTETMGLTIGQFNERVTRINAALLAVRATRDQPITDDKVLTAWNGLMIAGMADGGRVLEESRYVDAAARAAAEIMKTMRTRDGGLFRSFRAGRAKIDAFLVDYAFMIRGLLALHAANGDHQVLEQAVELAAAARTRFWDESAGAYYDTLPGQSDLFVRVKSTYDGAEPSGNGVMLNNLIDLHERTGDAAYLDDAVAAVEALSATMATRGLACVTSMLALHRIAEQHPDRLDEPVDAGPGGGGPVRISTSTRVVRLAAGASETFELEMRMADGFHVNANDPGLDYLIPLSVTAIDGQGIEISVEYPAGEPYNGPEPGMLVHHGKLTLPVTVTRVGEITDAARILVEFQVCTEQACLAPDTRTLEVRILSE